MSTDNPNEKEKTQGVKKNKISEETAEADLQRLLDSYDIVASDVALANGPEFLITVGNRLTRAIRSGHLEILDNGEVRHILKVPKGEITELMYSRFNGAALKEGDKTTGIFAGHCALMGSLCNMSERFMTKLDQLDIKIFQGLAQLFMAP